MCVCYGKAKRNTPEFLRQLKETWHPLVLTINGKAEVVVQDARSYQRVLDLAERLDAIAAVKEVRAAVECARKMLPAFGPAVSPNVTAALSDISWLPPQGHAS